MSAHMQSEEVRTSRKRALALVAALDVAERRILNRIVEGRSLRSMAKEFGISVQDAGDLKRSAMKKLDSRTTADLVRIALYGDAQANP